MQYIAALVSRDDRGFLVVEESSIQKGNSADIQEKVGTTPGDMAGVWENSSKEGLTTDEILAWVDMTLPRYLYVRSHSGECVVAADHYREQIEGID